MAFSQIQRGHVAHDVLFWIEARNRTTGAVERVGFWTGTEKRTFVVEGEAREYFAAGHLISLPVIVSRAGLNVQMQDIELSAVSAEVEQAIRGYDVRGVPCAVHVARFNPLTGDLIGIDRAFRGYVDTSPRRTPAKGEFGAVWKLSVASAIRRLTRALTLKRSDASQRRRGGDRFFRYADVAGTVDRYWGAERVGGSNSGEGSFS